MSKGYQIVEPASLAGILAVPESFELTVAVLSWLSAKLHEELKEQLVGAQLAVIRVEYHGAYPAIGIQYESNPNDLGPLVESTINRLLKECSVLELVSFVQTSGIQLRERTQQLLGS